MSTVDLNAYIMPPKRRQESVDPQPIAFQVKNSALLNHSNHHSPPCLHLSFRHGNDALPALLLSHCF